MLDSLEVDHIVVDHRLFSLLLNMFPYSDRPVGKLAVMATAQKLRQYKLIEMMRGERRPSFACRASSAIGPRYSEYEGRKRLGG